MTSIERRGSKNKPSLWPARRSSGIAASLRIAAADAVAVTIVGYRFNPVRLSIKVGSTVKWINAVKRTTYSALFTAPRGLRERAVLPRRVLATYSRSGRVQA